jgi:hypothetical protein
VFVYVCTCVKDFERERDTVREACERYRDRERFRDTEKETERLRG